LLTVRDTVLRGWRLTLKRAMDIDGLGGMHVEQFVFEGLIKEVSDLYRLHERRDELLGLDRWAEKSVDNLFSAIERSKFATFERFIFALGIRGVGESTARVLARRFGSLKALMEADEETLMAVEDIGPETARTVRDFFAEAHNREVIRRLLDSGVTFAEGPAAGPGSGASATGPLAGRTFLFTGTLGAMTRDEARALVESMGADTAAGVSKKVDVVVAGAEPGSKVEKAERLGIEIIDEKGFLKLVGRG